MKEQMREYLQNYKESMVISAEVKSLQARVKTLYDRQLMLSDELNKSVHPMCGSATKPHIRTFTDGTYTTLTVYWDHNLGHGRISVTKNEE